MSIYITYFKDNHQRNISRMIVLLFVVLSLALGSFPSLTKCIKFDNWEFAEKGEFETETDEKKGKEEMEKDDVYHLTHESSKVLFSSILEREGEFFGMYHQFIEIITPPPELPFNS